MFRKKTQQVISREQAAFLSRIQRRKALVLTIQWTLLFAFFLLWETAARYGWIDPFIFSQPSRMFAAGIQMAQDGSLWTHIGTTLWETVAGFVLGDNFRHIDRCTSLVEPFCFRCSGAVSGGAEFPP